MPTRRSSPRSKAGRSREATKKRRTPASSDPAVLFQQAEECRQRGQYHRAETLLKNTLAIVEQVDGKRHLNTAAVLNSLGVLYKYMGRFTNASRAYRRALEIVEDAAADRTVERDLACFLASLYHNLGGLEHARGRFARGEPYARLSVVVRRAALGDDHVDVAADEAALAALLDGQEKFDEAEQLYRSALAVFERHYGPEHYEVAVNLNNLAALHHMQNKFEEAAALYARALAIKERLLGKKHPDVAMTVHNWAVLAQERGSYAEAKRLYRRCLTIFRRTLDPGHPKLKTAEENLAKLEARMRSKA